WVNRVKVTEQQLAQATDGRRLSGKIYAQLQQLIAVRSRLLVLGSGSTEILQSGNQHLFAYRRQLDQQSVLCVVNFSEAPQPFTQLASQQLARRANSNPLSGAYNYLTTLSSVVVNAG
ncbi:alpha-glucosidase C-terminal domain-containing protein, partial [Alishewanella longhuensis]